MRELLVCPPEKRNKSGAVYRLRFTPPGRELVAWVEGKPRDGFRMAGVIRGLYVHDLAAGSSRALLSDDWFAEWGDAYPDPVVSADLCYLAAAIDSDDGESDGFVLLEDLRSLIDQSTDLPLPPYGCGELMFTPDGAELIAVRNVETNREYAPDVARFEMRAFIETPAQFTENINPFTRKPYRVLGRDFQWKRVCALPRGSIAWATALSADGRLLAVGTEHTGAHVVDLKRKKVVASLPWEGRKLRYTGVTRIAFDPAAKWVVLLASGRLFARPLGEGKAWNTKGTLGEVLDFAFHPDGRVLCAVFADGQARYLDPRSGAVVQSFQWAKRSRPLYSVAFAPDGLTCAAGAASGKVILWDVDA
jgi:WD40 repeat protein